MRIPRLLIPQAVPGAALEAGPEAYQHLIRVLRRQVGDPVLVLNGAGGLFRGRIASSDEAGRSLRVEILEEVRQAPPILPLGVAAAVPRGEGLEAGIRMASETGLARLQPLITARTVARPEGVSGKVRRWRRIAEESAKQCQRARPLEVLEPLSWKEFLQADPRRLPSEPASPSGWMALPGGPPPRESGLFTALKKAREPQDPPFPSLWVAIGPEGGFTPEEVGQALAAGLAPLGLPTPILRTATAIVYVSALAALAFLEPSEI